MRSEADPGKSKVFKFNTVGKKTCSEPGVLSSQHSEPDWRIFSQPEKSKIADYW